MVVTLVINIATYAYPSLFFFLLRSAKKTHFLRHKISKWMFARLAHKNLCYHNNLCLCVPYKRLFFQNFSVPIVFLSFSKCQNIQSVTASEMPEYPAFRGMKYANGCSLDLQTIKPYVANILARLINALVSSYYISANF